MPEGYPRSSVHVFLIHIVNCMFFVFLILLVTVLLNDSTNGHFKKFADFNVDTLDGIITLITSKELFCVEREDTSTEI